MISIIVCSRIKTVPESFSENVAHTIGSVKYEIVWIDNSEGKLSIFEAYNQGVQLSKGDILCFMHDDVRYVSADWGSVCERELSSEKIGLLGVLGTHYLSPFSAYWLSSGLNHGRILQGSEHNGKHQSEEWNWSAKDNYSKYVVAIDGLWFCCRKNLFAGKIKFDERTYNGFHMYDMDLSMQVVMAGYLILVTDEVLVEHTRVSYYDTAFRTACKRFHKKWNNLLPVMSEPIKEKDIRNFELNVVDSLCNFNLLERELRDNSNHPLHRAVQKLILLWRKIVKSLS